jgi:cytoplasmic iron level regulating protein YaaA (DUF328/UPF0246 family)
VVKGSCPGKPPFAKMARGEMVRYLAENAIETPEGVKGFQGLGYKFSKEYSSEKEYVFIKKAIHP